MTDRNAEKVCSTEPKEGVVMGAWFYGQLTFDEIAKLRRSDGPLWVVWRHTSPEDPDVAEIAAVTGDGSTSKPNAAWIAANLPQDVTATDRSVMSRLVSPNAFDGNGPVPEKVYNAARRIAQLRVKFLTTNSLMTAEVKELFDATALQAEWMRELYEAVHDA